MTKKICWTASILKTSFKYYLANGACIEYALSPDCSLIEVVDNIALAHFEAENNCPVEVFMKPELVHALNKECTSRFSIMLGNLNQPTGMQVMKIETVVGPVIITAMTDMEFPIFAGSMQELKDNSFSVSMEKILCE